MSTALLIFALLVALGLITFVISLGLTGLGVLLAWIFPLTPFQGTLVHLALFVLAMAFIGVTLLFERCKDVFWSPAVEEDEFDEAVDFRLRDGSGSSPQRPLSPRSEVAKIGRNDPCPCGSGKKYKFCCLMKR
jgi:SEC-C motif-containing protein